MKIKHTNPDGTSVEIFVGKGATIGKRATVGEHAAVGKGAAVGEGATVGEWATVGAWAKVGKRATVGEWAAVGKGATVIDDADWSITVGSDPRGYAITAQRRDGVLIITAGCRTFTEDEAKAHWGHKDYKGGPNLGGWFLAAVAYARAIFELL